VLGTARATSAPFVVTEIDAVTGAMFARNPWNASFGERVAFADLAGRQTQWTGDRREFLGRLRTLDRPAALTGANLAEAQPAGRLSNRTGAGLDPCCALQTTLTLAPDESTEIVFFLGQAANTAEAQSLLKTYRSADLDAILHAVRTQWDQILGTIQVKTPDRSLDIMLNRWTLYQTLTCRMWARAAFYQASGAYGFRDQLQDAMALTITQPALTRAHLLRAAGRQFVEGDVQHWWQPPTQNIDGAGVRTRISDDHVWLAYATAHYVQTSGDTTILDATIPFLEGPLLQPAEHDAYYKPEVSDQNGSLFDHCARALDRSLQTGTHGLPLMGAGDWNDGMNRVGELGLGESVWLGWFLHATLVAFAAIARTRGESAQATRWLTHAQGLQASLEREAWDGDWYRRGYFDDGTPLGSAANSECRIDSIAQSWGVLSGAAEPERAQRAMASLERNLIQDSPGLALLFTPPFEHAAPDPGYVKAYPPGIRENGGHYSHAAIWSVMAYAALGQGERATSLLSLLNPIARTRTLADLQRYKVEPYVIAADIYSVAPHAGRGGWTWYTGSAGWMYRAGIESILGFRLHGTRFTMSPCIPAAWPHFEIEFRYGSARYDIRVSNPHRVSRGIARIELDGVTLPIGDLAVPLTSDGQSHSVLVTLGDADR
jgi:cyclic beta-1,2-glucan synthetase